MAPPPLVSVVLPHRDRRDVLAEAIASVLAQTVADLELIVVDDGSRDGSQQVVDEVDDDRVVTITLPGNEGVCRARNAGIDAARGRYLAFQDSDDLWAPRKLERQLAWFAELRDRGHDDIAVVACCGRVEGTRIVEGAPHLAPGPYGRLDVLTGRLRERTPMLLLDRTRTAPDARFDARFPAVVERDFVLSSLADGGSFAILPEVLVTIRRGRGDHVANATRALASYELYPEKYAADMEAHPDIAAWYAFQALRTAIRVRRLRRAATMLRPARPAVGWRIAPHVAAGVVGGRRGLNAAQRLLPVHPPIPAPAAGRRAAAPAPTRGETGEGRSR